MGYDFPDDLLQLQQDLNTACAELSALVSGLLCSVELMEAWQRPEGYWLAASPAYPDSPGWSEQEQKDVAALRERERDLAAAIVTHRFWNEIAGSERPDARSQLRYAFGNGGGEGQEA
ncbi:nucleic acid-binding protein [Streptomyces acidicola]|uniref:Nucleic acid-binding protein n=1 Tax=Streptomyces acidicola TaxID=2596892 RepID=A0A5N8X326_9ACTN|nr:nucleic acid-binding protein [Streptomyces acidicola]MPY53973.1 nucleic acid-binding protein [Streptomyces acidicola]